MMSESFFKVQMNRLRETYGEKNYNAERIRMYWDMVRHLENDEFRRFVDHQISTNYRAPLGDKFIEFVKECDKRNHKKKRAKLLESIEKGELCKFCGNEGLTLAKSKATGVDWCFGCSFCNSYADKGMNVYTDIENTIPLCKWDNCLSPNYQLYPLGDYLRDQITMEQKSPRV